MSTTTYSYQYSISQERRFMYHAKHNRNYNLKRKHLWPSILLFLIYLVIVRLLLVLVVTLFTGNEVKTKIIQSEKEVENLSWEFNKELSYTYDKSAAINNLAAKNPEYKAFALLTKENIMTEHVGKITAEMGESAYFINSHDFGYLYDKKTKEKWFLESGKYNWPWKAILRKTLSGYGRGKAGWTDEVVYKEPYWIKAKQIGTEDFLLVKCNLTLYRNELVYVFALFAGVVVLLFIPVIFLLLNVIARYMNQRRLYQMFYSNSVTSGKNWMYYRHYAEKQMKYVWNAGRTYAIIDLQLERYRTFCACNGVAKGEELLEQIYHEIDHFLEKRELCIHYAKSNYALLLWCENEEVCKERVEELIFTLENMSTQNHMHFHGGIYMVYPERIRKSKWYRRRTDLDIAQLYNYAGEARASLSACEESAVAVFNNTMLEERLWQHWVENEMERALEEEEFSVYLQPKYNPVNNTMVGAEALVRWINEEKGFIPPNRFIPIFEHNGFISKLDDYMVSHVAKQQSEWLAQGKDVVPVSVNVSRVHFASPELAEHLCSLVDEYQTPHHLIEFEVTESAFFENKKTLQQTIEKLKSFGFELSMDDFGAGYSSLNSLKDLPLDILKIDAEFFRGEDSGQRGDIIVGETIKLAKRLNMKTVAEGIETKEQTEFLAEHGCDMIQGYYYAKPMPVSEFEEQAFVC